MVQESGPVKTRFERVSIATTFLDVLWGPQKAGPCGGRKNRKPAGGPAPRFVLSTMEPLPRGSVQQVRLIGSIGNQDWSGTATGDPGTAQPITGPADVAVVLATLKSGQTVTVGFTKPNGSHATVKVTLGEYPGSTVQG